MILGSRIESGRFPKRFRSVELLTDRHSTAILLGTALHRGSYSRVVRSCTRASPEAEAHALHAQRAPSRRQPTCAQWCTEVLIVFAWKRSPCPPSSTRTMRSYG